tara:strand:- start:32527 stop:33030 length:504 start_codon:yes stop_codon:yes gene_type:complete
MNEKTAQSSNPNNKKKKPFNKKRRKRPYNKNRPKGSSLEKAEKTYINLLEKHFQMRRKYFDLFHRADPKQLAKLERQFSNSAKEMRDFEDKLTPEVKAKFEKKYNADKPDITYSSNHGIDPEKTEPTENLTTPEEPHYLPSQKDSNFQEDTEESMGSIEDYQKYKGL